MMKQFDLSRFWLTLKTDNVLQWKASLRLTLGMAFALTTIYVVNSLTYSDSLGENRFYTYLNTCWGLTLFCFIFFMGIGGCFMASNMKTKQQRIAFLSLPSSNLEKFLSRFLWCTVGFFLFFCVAMVIADLLRAVFCLSVHGNACGSILVYHFKMLGMASFNDPNGNFEMEIVYAVIMVTSVALYSHSVYLLGGVFFRKFNWILTTVVCYAVSPFLALLNYYVDIEPVVKSDGLTTMAYIVTSVCLLLTVFNYWASYRLFCRSQVICNKIVNI
ncbi:MAG: hypothetical protein IJE12_04660 [Prevotella sp.]|nr:hypothetical protein [Prevotella sp.]